MATPIFRYYTTQRPPSIGCIPKGACEVVFLDDNPIIADIGRRAWGYADYARELSEDEVEAYELVRAKNVDNATQECYNAPKR